MHRQAEMLFDVQWQLDRHVANIQQIYRDVYKKSHICMKWSLNWIYEGQWLWDYRKRDQVLIEFAVVLENREGFTYERDTIFLQK